MADAAPTPLDDSIWFRAERARRGPRPALSREEITRTAIALADGEGLEAVQKFTDDALTECPNCQGRLKKVFSAVGIVFKGSGFYRNDSRSSGSSGGDTATSGSSGGSDGAGSAKEPAAAKSDGAGSSAAKDGGSTGSPGAGSNGSGASTAKEPAKTSSPS